MIVAESVWREYYRSRDENLKDELVLAHLSLVKYLAGRLAIRLPAHISQEDLESYGIFGLLEAVEKYNPDLGVSFKSYAYNRIRGAMLDEIRKLNWVSPHHVAEGAAFKCNQGKAAKGTWGTSHQ
jgi:RNA polymerase sigma factor for flagellar operon FliA